MAHGEVTITIDRPIEAVFDFLADGENDKLFSKRIIEIAKTTPGPAGVGTVYRSRAKDFGRTSTFEFEITVFERPARIHWHQLSKGPVLVDGGYEFSPAGDSSTELTFFSDLQGRGFGKLILWAIVSRAKAGLPAFAQSIKETIEARV